MSNVIPFPRDRRAGGSTLGLGPMEGRATGEILLFLGVRYERHIDMDPQNAVPDGLDRVTGTTPRRRKIRRRA
ncbi:MAG: hypothetical protein ACRC7G_05310 [Beijerinckiaceae bacterium]